MPDLSGAALGGLALVMAAALWGLWFVQIQRLKTRQRAPFLVGAALTLAVGISAFATGGTGWLGGIAAGLGSLLGGGFLGLRLASPQAKAIPAVEVGGKMLAFEASDHRGEAFSISELAGKPFLLKFFRGHW